MFLSASPAESLEIRQSCAEGVDLHLPLQNIQQIFSMQLNVSL
jgi:hypothetical protein